MRRLRTLVGIAILFFPFAVSAEESTVWDFTTADIPQLINNGLTTVERTSEGLHIRTDEDGFIGWQGASIPRTDIVTIEAKSPLKTEAAFMWQPLGGSPGDFYKLFITTSGKNAFEDLDVSLASYKEWDQRTPIVAIAFPAGTDIVIRSIAWRSWNPLEKLGEAVKSFLTFDTIGQYSINFLWGPLLTFDPVTRSTMFDSLPPAGVSAMRVAYGIIILAAIAGAASYMMERKRRGVMIIVVTVAGLWLLLDLRMGMELLAYATNDLRSFVLASGSQQSFRTLDDEPAVMDKVESALSNTGVSRIVLIEPEGRTYLSNVRLRAYPVDVLAFADGMPPAAHSAWLVLKTPGFSVKDGFVTAADGHALSAKGSVIANFGNDSFLFLEQ